MNKRAKKTLYRAENILNKYINDNSVYYKELHKSYYEFKNIDNLDKTTQDLYITHINKMCDFIVQRRQANILIATMILILIFMITLTSYSTYSYYDLSKNMNQVLLSNKTMSSLIVNYKDMDNLSTKMLINDRDYQSLKPMKIELLNQENDGKESIYNIYIILDESLKDDYKYYSYAINTLKDQTGIKYLKDTQISNNKLLIYSNTLKAQELEEIEIRLWIDKKYKDLVLNKDYKLQIYVDGTIIAGS